ncbi:HAMP domain-containing sensor histidine kinase [Cellvibrio sp. pealriver]|uniref:sensor histidine kinase n=1 Tax=Cellvibrio sp. pealriver TaxID=1622269 RepID=UPI00066FF9CD|nr:HAMP domain-containing sensor histidine kinase [Cellvibrio sp. pealriver]
MTKGSSIRKQTLTLLLGLTLGLTLVFGLLALLVAFVVEDMLLDNWITEQAGFIERYFALHNRVPELPFEFMQVLLPAEQLPDWVVAAVVHDALSGEIFTPDQTHYHYRQLVLGQKTGYLLAEVSGLLVVTRQPEIFSIFLIVFVLVLLVAVVLAVQFSRRIVNPVMQLTDAVKNVDLAKSDVATKGNENEKVQLNAAGLPDELMYLADQLQTSFDKREQLLQCEKEFSTNISHELRTPLTLLKNTSVLIAQRGYKDSDLVTIDSVCDHMQRTVDILFSLARAKSLPVQLCHINLILEEAILKCQPWLNHFQIELHLSPSVMLSANPQLLELLFINLLRNAAEHASEPLLIITYADGKLEFENTIVHCPTLDVSHPGGKSEKSNGIGLGLYLIKQIADQFCCEFSVETNSRYFKAILRLPHPK